MSMCASVCVDEEHRMPMLLGLEGLYAVARSRLESPPHERVDPSRKRPSQLHGDLGSASIGDLSAADRLHPSAPTEPRGTSRSDVRHPASLAEDRDQPATAVVTED